MNGPIHRLSTADPELAAGIASRLEKHPDAVDTDMLSRIVDEILAATSQEIAFGRAVAHGFAALIGHVDPRRLRRYRRLIRFAGRKGPTLGNFMAVHLVPVLQHGGPKIFSLFIKAVGIMERKGTYTLKEPMAAAVKLLHGGEPEALEQYLVLLIETFGHKIAYDRCRRFARELPGAVDRMSPMKKPWQIRQIRRVVSTDARLLPHLLAGLPRGLDLLSESALAQFVATALDKAGTDGDLAGKFLALASQSAVAAFSDLQTAVPLSRVRSRLNRYLRARLDRPVGARPGTEMPQWQRHRDAAASVCTDRRFIYLPAEIDHFATMEENDFLYRILVKLEAGLLEFGTFDFDLEKAGPPGAGPRDRETPGDLERFLNRFPNRRAARDLFTVFEHGRLRVLTARAYPGIVRDALPLLHQEALAVEARTRPVQPVWVLYRRIALGMPVWPALPSCADNRRVDDLVRRFDRAMAGDAAVEASAGLTATAYETLTDVLNNGYIALQTPFDRRICPELFSAASSGYEKRAGRIKAKLAAMGVTVFKSDLLGCLIENRGVLTRDDLRRLVRGGPKSANSDTNGRIQWDRLDLSERVHDAPTGVFDADESAEKVFWYGEWHSQFGDYLPNHVRVADRQAVGGANDFYDKTLAKHSGLIQKIRRSFEWIKPEGLAWLRRWVDGDAFDYRALVDYAVDKKRGHVPSDRLYNKRVKRIRDVAVLLLIDLSRSTANKVPGGFASVMDVEKEAVVLFCEALGVSGDDFAVAGYSGSGRLGVDYFRIKDFEEKMNESVKQRIGALAPRRNTRMGAAVRHAAARFRHVRAKVRLLMLLGDGFPNDTDYKGDHAVSDTRRAIQEAFSDHLSIHAITVNLGADPRLDDLYGRTRHTVISEVVELPDKLPRIYGSLTKN